MQPMIGMTSLKSPGETGEYKAFEKIMQPQNLSQLTKEIKRVNDPWEGSDLAMGMNDLDEIQLIDNMLGGTEQKQEGIFEFTHSNKELHDLKSIEEPPLKPKVEQTVPAHSRARQQQPQRNVFEYHQSSDESEDPSFVAPEWELSMKPHRNVENIIENFLDHQIEKLIAEYTQ